MLVWFGRHDHGEDGQKGKKVPSWKIIAQEKKCNGDAEDRSSDHGPYSEKEGIQETLKIKRIRKKVVEVHQGENPLICCNGVVEEADQGIDQEKTKKGPDRRIADKATDLHLGPEARLRNSNG